MTRSGRGVCRPGPVMLYEWSHVKRICRKRTLVLGYARAVKACRCVAALLCMPSEARPARGEFSELSCLVCVYARGAWAPAASRCVAAYMCVLSEAARPSALPGAAPLERVTLRRGVCVCAVRGAALRSPSAHVVGPATYPCLRRASAGA